MTDLYRGLLSIFTSKFYNMIEVLRNHTRSFKSETADPSNYLDVGILGFWNLILEIILTLFVIGCLTIGIVLLLSLAIVSYPCEAVLSYSAKLLHYTRNPVDEQPVIIKNDQEKK